MFKKFFQPKPKQKKLIYPGVSKYERKLKPVDELDILTGIGREIRLLKAREAANAKNKITAREKSLQLFNRIITDLIADLEDLKIFFKIFKGNRNHN